jgi:hypothetical protein
MNDIDLLVWTGSKLGLENMFEDIKNIDSVEKLNEMGDDFKKMLLYKWKGIIAQELRTEDDGFPYMCG